MFETQGGTRNRTRDLPKKGSAFVTSSDHWTLCAESVLSLGVCENRDGWLFAWGLCGSMLIRFSTVWLLPFTLL